VTTPPRPAHGRRPDVRATLVTPRLRLVPLAPADADDLHPVLDDTALHRFTGGAPLSRARLEARFARLAAGPPAGSDEGWGNWVVRQADTGAAIGTVQATLRDDGAVVAWVIGTGAQGRGYASEAARALVAWLIEGGAVRVSAHIHPDHVASAAVARSAGLVPTGRADDDGELVWERTAPS
jgi:RimJ/RimL family protein N-acetyltransferase